MTNYFPAVNNLNDADIRVNINPITLSFNSENLNGQFSEYRAQRSLRLVRLSMVIAILIYLVFGLIQDIILPQRPEIISTLRLTGILFFLSVIFLTFTDTFRKYYQYFLTLLIIVGGIDVIFIVINGKEFLYVGLILSLIYAHSLLRMSFLNATVSTWLLVFTYLLVSYTEEAATSAQLINSMFFLSSANILGMFASYGIEYYMRSEFLMTTLLKQKSAELKSEFERKSDELEAARRIQLSMLPQELPVLESFDISAQMRTASEIGGDYYDFIHDEDGTLTFTIGDATGHGAQAGAMVTAIKTLFSNYASRMEIADFMKKANHFLKQVKLPKLFMSLAVGKLKDDVLEIAGVGLPSMLIRRPSSSAIEKIPLKGLPLGSFANFPFVIHTIKLNPGDSFVLYTDGLPEAFNKENEMLGDDRIENQFLNNSDKPVNEITDLLMNYGCIWSGNLQQDDITILSFRMKELEDSTKMTTRMRQSLIT